MQFEKAYKGWRQRMEIELDRTIDLANKAFLKVAWLDVWCCF